jgi:Reverse transcriptase (RNA-dependent DNA polymerase)
VKIVDGVKVYLMIYVDDIIGVSKEKALLRQVLAELKKEYDMKDLGDASWILGMKITRDRNKKTLTIDQTQYIEGKVKEFGMENAKPESIPMSKGGSLLTNIGELPDVPYRSIVGSLMYAMVLTRPDICYAVGVLSRFLDSFSVEHWNAAKRVLAYLNHTADFKLTFKGENHGHLNAFVDASYGDEANGRRSTSGFIVRIGQNTISWSSKKQSTVALSTAEAEYVAAAAAVQEVMSIDILLKELGVEQPGPIKILEDNQACIALSNNPIDHGRTKHVDIKYHFIREQVLLKKVDLVYCPSAENVADLFTM